MTLSKKSELNDAALGASTSIGMYSGAMMIDFIGK